MGCGCNWPRCFGDLKLVFVVVVALDSLTNDSLTKESRCLAPVDLGVLELRDGSNDQQRRGKAPREAKNRIYHRVLRGSPHVGVPLVACLSQLLLWQPTPEARR